jgi:hypothetical protein
MAKKNREIKRFGSSNARQYFENLGIVMRTNPTGGSIYSIADAAVESGEKRKTVISAALALACGIVDLKYGDSKRIAELEREHSDSEADGLREKLKSPSPADQLDREFAEAVAGIEESAGGKECGEVAFTMTLEIKKHSTQGPGGWLHPDFVVGFFKQSLVQKVRNQETSETKPGESDPVRERMARAESVDREFRDAIEKLNGMADDYDEGDLIIAIQFSVIKSWAQTESPGVFLHPDHAIEKFKKTLTAAVSGELAARMKANAKAKPSKPDKYKVILAPGESRCLDPDQYQFCHDLKCHPGSFRAILSGAKTAEFRKMDRDYQVGDYIILMEYRESSEYSGDKCWVEITHITDGCQFGIPDGYGMLSVKLIPPGS